MTTEREATQLEKLAHYVCWVCDDPRLLRPARLHRILWYAERSALLKTGKALSGVTFVKRPAGPVCPLLGLALSALESANLVAIRQHSHTSHEEQYFAIAPPQLDGLSAEQISILDMCIWAVCWEQTWVPRQSIYEEILAIARLGEEIPIHTAYAGVHAPIEDEDLAWALKLSNRLPLELDRTEVDELIARDARIDDVFSAVNWYIERRPGAGLLLPGLRDHLYYFKQRGMSWTDIPDIGVLFEIEQGRGKVRAYHFSFPDVHGEDSLIPPFGQV